MAETYKKTVKGTLGAGVNSLFGGASNYYVLEHKVSSKYHKTGEAQEIIVDYVEIGRDKDCAVRFDESFETVSRHHAAIVKKDDNWKLVQLSQTNSTFLNGHKVADEWYLQNGDEIQLSFNGPKLGFIIPETNGKKNTINLTNRMRLFGQQALRPYRNVIIILGVILFFVIGGGVFYGIKLEEERRKTDELQETMMTQADSLSMLSVELASTQDSLEMAQIKREIQEAENQQQLEELRKQLEALNRKLLDLQRQERERRAIEEEQRRQEEEQRQQEEGQRQQEPGGLQEAEDFFNNQSN